MKYIFILSLLFGIVSCSYDSNKVEVTKINEFEYVISGHSASNYIQKFLLKKANELCNTYTIKNTANDRYGDVTMIHIQCTIL